MVWQDFKPPSGQIKSLIARDFGSVDNLIGKFNPKAAAIQACFGAHDMLS